MLNASDSNENISMVQYGRSDIIRVVNGRIWLGLLMPYTIYLALISLISHPTAQSFFSSEVWMVEFCLWECEIKK